MLPKVKMSSQLTLILQRSQREGSSQTKLGKKYPLMIKQLIKKPIKSTTQTNQIKQNIQMMSFITLIKNLILTLKITARMFKTKMRLKELQNVKEIIKMPITSTKMTIRATNDQTQIWPKILMKTKKLRQTHKKTNKIISHIKIRNIRIL